MTNVTNRDIYTKVSAIQTTQVAQGVEQQEMKKDIRELKDWKIAIDAVAAARKPILGDNIDWKAVAAVAATIIAAVYAAIKQAG